MSKTATTPPMEYEAEDAEFYVGQAWWCCGWAPRDLFKLPSFKSGAFIRLRFGIDKMPSSRRIWFSYRRRYCTWAMRRRMLPGLTVLSPLQTWLRKHFPGVDDGKPHGFYVQVLPGKRGGKPYPVRKD